MAKITLQDVLSGYLSATALTQNFEAISEEFQNKVLYRNNPNGEPNHMENNIDMNSNRLLNLPNATTNNEPVTLGQLLDTQGEFVFSGTYTEEQVAIDGQSVFNLNAITYDPGTGNISVYINGVRQYPSAYSEVSSTSLTFSEALVEGDEVLFVVNERQTETVGGGGGTGNFSNPATSNLNMNGYKIVGLSDGTSSADAVTFGQLVTTNTNVSNLTSTVNSNTSSIANLQSDMSTAQVDISTIETELSTIVLKDSDIGVNVQAYDADIPTQVATNGEMTAGTETGLRTMSPALISSAISALGGGGSGGDVTGPTSSVDNRIVTFDGTTGKVIQDSGSLISDLLTSSDIGVSVQGYDIDTAKYDATTANFTGTLQNGGSNVVVDTDIGVSVQAYDADISVVAASQAEMEAGTEAGLRTVSPLRVKQAIDALSAGSGDVDGPAGATDGNVAAFDGTTGKLLQDSGIAFSDLLTGSSIGVTIQAYDADLTTIAGLAKTDGNFIVGNGTAWTTESGSTVRTSLGLGSLATQSSINDTNWSGSDLAIVNGGTGSSSASGARINLGLEIGSDVQAYDADIPTVAASQAEMEAGTQTSLRSMSPLRIKQAIDALAPSGGGSASYGVVATIAALRSNTNSTPDVFYVRGYSSINDGGEGFFIKDTADTTSADNTGIIIVDSGNRRWKRYVPNAEYSVKWFGARGDGTNDDTAEIQSALTTAAADEIYTVRVPSSDDGYVIANNIIELPYSTELIGSDSWNGPHLYSGDPADYKKGSVFLVTTGSGTTTGQAISMTNGSRISGINFYYPNQVETSPPNLYPPTIRLKSTVANLVSIENITMINPYIAVDASGGHQQLRIKNFAAQALSKGIIVDDNTGTDKFSWISIEPIWHRANWFTNVTDSNHVCNWTQKNGIAFDLGRVDGFNASDIDVFGYQIGVNMTGGSSNRPYGTFTNTGLDSCQYCVFATGDSVNPNGMYFVNCFFIPASTVTTPNYGVFAGTGVTNGTFLIQNSVFWGKNSSVTACIDSAANVMLVSNCSFNEWGDTTYAVGLRGAGRMSLSNCRFTNKPVGSDHIYINAGAGAALQLTGCAFEDAVDINNTTSTSVLQTASMVW